MTLTLFSNDIQLYIKQKHWICKVKMIFNNCGLSCIWQNQYTLDNSLLKDIIYCRIYDIALKNGIETYRYNPYVHYNIDNLSINSVLKNTCLYLAPERGSH